MAKYLDETGLAHFWANIESSTDAKDAELLNKVMQTLTPTKIHDLDIPSGYYTQGLAIADGVIYVLVVSSSSGNPRIYTYDLTTGSQITYKEYSTSTVGHGNSLTIEPNSGQLITPGPSNNSLVYIDMSTLEVVGSHTLAAPLSEFCIRADGSSAFAIATGRRVGQQYFKDAVDNYYVARNNAPLYMNDLIGQDISYSRGANNFVAGVFLRDIDGAHYNYIYQIDCHNGFSNRIYFVDVPTTTEIEGIAVYNDVQYITDAAGGFYSVGISSDYRTSVSSLYPLLNWNLAGTLHKSTFSNGTNTFEIPVYFPIPYDIRDFMQGVPILFRATGNTMQLMANNMGGTIRGFTVTNDGAHTICLEYTCKNTNLAYLSRVRIDGSTTTFSGTDVSAIAIALDTFISGLSLTTNIGLTMRGYGVTPYGLNNTMVPVSV